LTHKVTFDWVLLIYTILVPWTASGEGTFFLYNIYDNQVSSVSFASAYWAPFCPHPPTNVPSVHITQTPTICKHRPTCLRPTNPWHTCSYQPPMKRFWFSIWLSTSTILSSQWGPKIDVTCQLFIGNDVNIPTNCIGSAIIFATHLDFKSLSNASKSTEAWYRK
jgi:hypothetical protein